jgi:hypothetical protein
MEERLRERLPISQWPDLERRMAIMSRMTSDPPPKLIQEDNSELIERVELVLPYSEDSEEIKR